MHDNCDILLTIIIKFEVAGQQTVAMAFVSLVGTEKISPIDATMWGVSVDTRKQRGIIKYGS